MYYSKLLGLTILIQAAAGVVTFYGLQGPASDSVACSSTVFDDAALANLIAIEIPADVVRDGNAFTITTSNLTCGSDTALAAATICGGLSSGTTTCNSPPLSSRLKRRQAPAVLALGRPLVYYCTDFNATCDSNVDIDSMGNCPSDYKKATVQGQEQGQGPYSVCTQPCTEVQHDVCIEAVCNHRRTECAIHPDNKMLCQDALIKCREQGPVAMNEGLCEDPGFLSGCDGCLSYASGACSLDNAKYEAFLGSNKDPKNQPRLALVIPGVLPDETKY